MRLTTDDLTRVRFSPGPAPLVETVFGFARLRHRSGLPTPDGWVRRSRLVFPAPARPLRDLIPASGPWPEFLDPAVADLDEGLEMVSATPRTRLRRQLSDTWHRPGHPPLWLKALADGDREALATTVGALRAFYRACVEPGWAGIEASFRFEVTERSARLAGGGLAELFGTMHPDLTLQDGVLHRAERSLARAGLRAEFQLHGRGLQLLPSMLWDGPPLFSIHPPDPLVSTMIYPVRTGSYPGHGLPAPDLNAVFGRTRAGVLGALRDPCGTTELAARTKISVSSASEHATALRDAGLIQTERQGQNVRHSLTRLGRSLLGGPSRPVLTTRTGGNTGGTMTQPPRARARARVLRPGTGLVSFEA